MEHITKTHIGEKELLKINESITNVPLYRNNEVLKEEQDIEKVRIYSKEDVRNNWEKCISDKVSESDLIIDYTSGSTGKPFKIGRTSKDMNIEKRNIWKYRNGYLKSAIAEKHVEFGRNMRYFIQHPDEISVTKGSTLFIKGVLSASLVKEYVKIMNDFQPKWLLGPASFLAQFVELAKKDCKLDIQPHFVENAGEFLYPDTKHYLESYFKCPVISHYGARELWPLALECKCGKMHVLEDNAVIEVINADEEGYGELLLTSLQIESMPLLRYRIGDIGRLRASDCKCGNTNKILELVGARTNDYAESRDGKKVGAFFFSTIFVDRILRRGYSGILNWRIIQHDYDEFEIIIVRGADYDSEVEDILAKYIHEEFSDARIKFTYRDKIELGTNGKMKYFINEIHKNA